MRGVRLYPHWHGYALKDWRCLEFVRTATAARWPVSLPFRVEDRRQQSWLVDVPNVALADAVALARAVPEGRFIFGNGSGFTALARPANVWLEISLLTALLTNEIGRLLAAPGGEDRLLFGSGMPFHYPEGAVAKLEVLEATAAVKEKIARGNARALLSA